MVIYGKRCRKSRDVKGWVHFGGWPHLAANYIPEQDSVGAPFLAFGARKPALSAVEGWGLFSRGANPLLGLAFCSQSAVAMRFAAGLAASEFTLLTGLGTASRALHCKGLLWTAFFFHHGREDNARTRVRENGHF
jgi:hypothetical protein